MNVIKGIFKRGDGGSGVINANKALQTTQTARWSFSLFLSQNGLRVSQVVLPVVTARYGRLNAGVSAIA